jgi:RNA polymerase sigma-70 factor, ECF subfamily
MEAHSKQQKFKEIYESEIDTLFRYCRLRVNSKAQAIDIVQDVFIEFWVAFQREEIKSPRAFLFTILRNRIIDYYRKKKALSLDSIMEKSTGEIPFEVTDERAENEVRISSELNELKDAINNLPPNYRDAVYLRLIEDLSPPEIASILKSNVNIVSIRITRGISKLKKDLNIEL